MPQVDNSMRENTLPMAYASKLYKSNYDKIDWGSGNAEEKVINRISNLSWIEFMTAAADSIKNGHIQARVDVSEVKCPVCQEQMTCLTVKRADCDIKKWRETMIYGCKGCDRILNPKTRKLIEPDESKKKLDYSTLSAYIDRYLKEAV